MKLSYSPTNSTLLKENKPNSSHSHHVLYENRYCNQEGFSILVCGGKHKNDKFLNRVLDVKVPSFEVCDFPSMLKPRSSFTLVSFNNDILAVGGDVNYSQRTGDTIRSIEIYSNKTDNWQQQYFKIEER